ncbi:MAG: hypothetical protein DRH50_10830 [Deltaproteobacteria bacterium]|nr:MAG: hypothetical protein DRH50_10830 [Deltaproteobacteria bacterium]
MNKFKEWVGFIAAVLSIGAIVLSVYNYFTIDKLQQFYANVKPLGMEIVLSEPNDGAEVGDCVTKILGDVRIRAAETSVVTTDINITLAEQKIEVIPFVRPRGNLWYAQARPVISPKGILTGSVILGERDGRGIGDNFEIVVLAVSEGTVQRGDSFKDLPLHGCASNTVTVKRTL